MSLKAAVIAAREMVTWYGDNHYRRPSDLGLIDTFTSQKRVGHFAVTKRQVEQANGSALFKLLLCVSCFQRLRDSHVMGILKALSRDEVTELSSLNKLKISAENNECHCSHSNHELLHQCSLAKDPNGNPICERQSSGDCYLKRHTALLRRYGHFGKLPSSAALYIRSVGRGINDLYHKVLIENDDPSVRAHELIMALSNIWRISDKISSMYLTLMCCPDIGIVTPPWMDGIDWTQFIVVDTNVDAFLAAVGYSSRSSYAARSSFIREVSCCIDLKEMLGTVHSYHPRLVQQAIYMFMSRNNRSQNPSDCRMASSCHLCPRQRKQYCPFCGP